MTEPPRMIRTPEAARPGGHYSQVMLGAGLGFVSGQLPVGVDGSHTLAGAPFAEQADQALANLLAIVAAAGAAPAHILKVTVYIVGIEHWPVFDAIYARRMGDARPARAVVPVPELHHGYLVEVDAVFALCQ